METFKIFSPQIQEIYRILLVETTLESIVFYYTLSVINTMFVPWTALLYDSAAATRTLKLSATLFRISCGIHLISLLMKSSLVCGWFSQTEAPPHFSDRTLEYLRHNFQWDRLISCQTDTPCHPIHKISSYFMGEGRGRGVPKRQNLWKQSTDKRGLYQKRNQMNSSRIAQWSCGQL